MGAYGNVIGSSKVAEKTWDDDDGDDDDDDDGGGGGIWWVDLGCLDMEKWTNKWVA